MPGVRRADPGKRRISLIFALLFLIFLGILDYPFLSRLYNESRQEAASVAYQEAGDRLSQDEQNEMLGAAREYNRHLASGVGMKLTDAFGAEDEAESVNAEEHEEYESLLDTDGRGTMGRIEIPKIGVDLLIGHGTSEEVLQNEAGHLEGSSLPVGGEDTHACLSAHRGLAGKELFTSLDQLEEGDVFLIHVAGETLCYRVGDICTVLPDETEKLAIRQGEDLVTLITCTPYGINTHRLCVEGYRIPYTEDVIKEVQEQTDGFRMQRFIRDYGWIILSLVLIAIMCVMLFRYNRRDAGED